MKSKALAIYFKQKCQYTTSFRNKSANDEFVALLGYKFNFAFCGKDLDRNLKISRFEKMKEVIDNFGFADKSIKPDTSKWDTESLTVVHSV